LSGIGGPKVIGADAIKNMLLVEFNLCTNSQSFVCGFAGVEAVNGPARLVLADLNDTTNEDSLFPNY